MKKNILLFALALLPFLLFAQEEGSLAGTLTLYDSHSYQPFLVNSDGGWMEVRKVYKEDFNSILPPATGTIRKWRVKTTYIDESGQNGQSTLQVKLRSVDNPGTVFTLPWTEKASRWQEKNSNWFIPLEDDGMILDNNGVLSVRLIAPPRSSAPGKIYKIELEAWDFPMDLEDLQSEKPQLQMAFSTPSELMIPRDNDRSSDSMETKENAVKFSLDFVQHNIDGNLPGFYKSLSENLKDLETGFSQSRYRIAPPASDLSAYSLADYKRSYRYHIYGYDEYSELFPQWFEEGRRWSPDSSCYLFLGTEVLPGQVDFMKGQNLVFMVRQEKGQWKIIALPE
jgi:hypothetical protein